VTVIGSAGRDQRPRVPANLVDELEAAGSFLERKNSSHFYSRYRKLYAWQRSVYIIPSWL
jgi:hypothetical protein